MRGALESLRRERWVRAIAAGIALGWTALGLVESVVSYIAALADAVGDTEAPPQRLLLRQPLENLGVFAVAAAAAAFVAGGREGPSERL